jgi:hypothetical protein
MNRLKKELTKKGILYEADDFEISRGAEYDWCRRLVTITDQFIVTVMYSAVLNPEFQLFDRNTYEMIAQQNVLYADRFDNCNTWESYVWVEGA